MTEQLSGKENKKGQMSLFFILGIIIIAIVAFYLSSQKEAVKEPNQIPPDIQPVKLYLDNCLVLSSKKAFAEMGLQGGKRTLEAPFYNSTIVQTNYLYDEGVLKIDSFDFFKKNLELEIASNLENCFLNFSEPGFTFEKGTLNITISFLEKFSQINADWKVTVIKGGGRTALNSIEPVSLNVRLKLVYEIAENVTNSIKNNPEKLDFVALVSTGMNITIDATNETELFLIIDPESEIEQKPYGFVFAARIK